MLGSLGGEYENSIHYGPKKRTHKHANTVNPKRFTHCERKKLCFNRTKVRIAPGVTEKGRRIEYAITLRTATQCREEEKKTKRINVTKLNAFHRMGIYIENNRSLFHRTRTMVTC